MYRIMVAEDSKPIMRNIISQIESTDGRLKVVETAYNGEEALNKLNRSNIDILFTDIKMPKMDGLTLVQEARKKHPSLKCVIISGYNDFEYARQAIKLQIAEYLLKPLDTRELKTLLDNMIKDIEMERDQLLNNLLNDPVAGELPPGKLEINKFIIAIVRTCIGGNSPVIQSRSGLQNHIRELCPDRFYVIAAKKTSEKVILVEIPESGAANEHFWIEALLSRLKNDFAQVNIAVSNEMDSISELNKRYEKLSSMLDRLIIMDKPQIIHEDSSHHMENFNANEELERFRIKIHFLIKNRQAESFKKELSRFFTQWRNGNYPVLLIKRFLSLIMDNFRQAFIEVDIEIQPDFSSKIDELLSGAATCNDLCDKTTGLFNDFFLRLLESRKDSANELFNRIDIFLKQNIYNNISMQELSDKFNVSSSYITRVIKKHSSMSPMEYYMKLKIDEAKKLIDTNEHILFKDIADSLGFNDQHYFSKVFKSFIGCSPTDYKMNKPLIC